MVFLSEAIILVLIVLAGIVQIGGTRHFALFSRGLPDIGLWPIVTGSIMLTLCGIHFVEHRRDAAKNKIPPVNLTEIKRSASFMFFFIAMTLGAGHVIGLLPALAIFLFISFIIWNELRALTALLTTIGLVATVYCAFTIFMRVRFPMGLWG